MVYTSFEKKTELGVNVNEVLPQELYKTVITKFKRRKVYAWFKVDICAGDLAKMGSLSSFNCGVKYSYVINVFTKYALVKPLMDKMAKTVLYVFNKIINELNQMKVNRINYGLIKEEGFKITLKQLLDDDTLMYSTQYFLRSL